MEKFRNLSKTYYSVVSESIMTERAAEQTRMKLSSIQNFIIQLNYFKYTPGFLPEGS